MQKKIPSSVWLKLGIIFHWILLSSTIYNSFRAFNLNFVYQFGYRQDFQHTRVKYPLVYDSLNVKLLKDSKKWSYDKLFTDEQAIGILSDGLSKGNVVKEYVFSWIYAGQKLIKHYYFTKQEDKWLLTNVVLQKPETTPVKEDLYAFLNKLCSDSLFQKTRVQFPLEMLTLGENNEVIRKKVTSDKWRYLGFYYKCDSLPILRKNEAIGDECILTIQGVENGILEICKFKIIKNKWFLVGYEDVST
ncbi:MAG: DUF4348 domain-containing protein [Bacteroidia bacterium]